MKVGERFIEAYLRTRGNSVRSMEAESRTRPEKTDKGVEDFEALLIFNMLKELNKTSHLTKKEYAEETYMSIVYDKVSRFIAENKGIGIKDLLIRYQNKGGDVKF